MISLALLWIQENWAFYTRGFPRSFLQTNPACHPPKALTVKLHGNLHNKEPSSKTNAQLRTPCHEKESGNNSTTKDV